MKPLRQEDRLLTGGGRHGYGSVNGEEIPLIQMRSALDECEMPDRTNSSDEFEEQSLVNKITRTGRQRKKQAARTKGGEFQAKKKQTKRLYFCCISSSIDLEKLSNEIEISEDYSNSTRKMFEGVLQLFFPGDIPLGILDPDTAPNDLPSPIVGKLDIAPPKDSIECISDISTIESKSLEKSEIVFGKDLIERKLLERSPSHDHFEARLRRNSLEGQDTLADEIISPRENAVMLWAQGAREVFVFEFGAAVFWGFRKGEEKPILDLIKSKQLTEGLLDEIDFNPGQDDMAFITVSDVEENKEIRIMNDVVTMIDNTSAKSRLAVSFAIAQSAVLAVFEERVERKINEYKYIPESLAHTGKVKLGPTELGKMIGEVYQIRHGVNLHSEILDLPDFFWGEDAAEVVYSYTSNYLEMKARTTVLNMRLDMLRELLAVLQKQEDNNSSVKLEWVVIWLIVISASIELFAIAVDIVKS